MRSVIESSSEFKLVIAHAPKRNVVRPVAFDKHCWIDRKQADLLFVVSNSFKKTSYCCFQNRELNTWYASWAELVRSTHSSDAGLTARSYDVALQGPDTVDAKMGKG